MLVTTMVITHVTKSKCKLAIWTAVEWSMNPGFSKGSILALYNKSDHLI